MMSIINPGSGSARRLPQRTCVACRKVKTKRELIRIVHTPDGNIEIDGSGKKAGRGAYLCQTWRCWEAGLKSNRLEYALRSNLNQNNRERLIEQAKDVLKGDA